MKEVLVNSLSNAEYKIYLDGQLTDASGDVTVTVTRAGVKVLEEVVATKVSDTTGTYKVLLPLTVTIDDEVIPVTTKEGILEVTWNFTLSSNSMSVIEYYDVATPYSEWAYFQSSTGPSYVDYLECERVSRFIINSYCGQEFGQEETVSAVEGHGTIALALPRRLQLLNSVTYIYNPVVRSGQVIGSTGPAWEIFAYGWTIRQQPYPCEYNLDPTYSHDSRFRRNRTYNIDGLWGYASVPGPVVEASKILTADFLCREAKYRDKYLANITTGDWRLEFVDGAWQGTGNAKVDQLLLDYRLSPGIGLI